MLPRWTTISRISTVISIWNSDTYVHVLHEASEKKRRVFFHSTHTRTTTCTKTGSGIYVFPRADSDVPSRQLGDARTLCPQNNIVDTTPSKFFSSLVTSIARLRSLVLNNADLGSTIAMVRCQLLTPASDILANSFIGRQNNWLDYNWHCRCPQIMTQTTSPPR